MLAECWIRYEFNHNIITRNIYDFRTADKISVNWYYRMRKEFQFDDKHCLQSELMWAFASRAWGFDSTILSVSNVHMQIGHNQKDIMPKWYRILTEIFKFI